VAYLGVGHGAMSTPFRAASNFFQHDENNGFVAGGSNSKQNYIFIH